MAWGEAEVVIEEEEEGASVAMERVNILLAGVDWMDLLAMQLSQKGDGGVEIAPFEHRVSGQPWPH